MKKAFFLLMLVITYRPTFAQSDIIRLAMEDVDSILQIIEKEPEADKRFELLVAIFNTGVESYPGTIFETAQRLLSIANRNKDIVAEAGAWSFYGQGYRLSADYVKGLECHIKATGIAERSGSKSLLALTQNQMGHIYKDREEFQKAIMLYRAALVNSGKDNNKGVSFWPLMNLGAVYFSTNQLDSSLYFSNEALRIIGGENYTPYSVYILSNIAGAYSKRNQVNEANKYFTRAINARLGLKQSTSPRDLLWLYQGLSEHYLRRGMEDSSIYYSKKVVQELQGTVFFYLSLRSARILMDYYDERNADSATKYFKVYREANDTIYNTRSNLQLQLMTFEEDQRQQEMSEERKSYRSRVRTNLMLGGLGLILVVALFLYRNNRQKQKANKLLEATLLNLKNTQSQLIQSEKMASLGELTAGIAHEIQNPLNFVNNFSEVNRELLAEMNEAIKQGNFNEVNSIAKDVSGNMEKITHHGKRADAIVKGMLQHSRSSSGKKEPTDINRLADEYLRLAYHGLRAKDKSFNATLKTDFDPATGMVPVIPQDLGRVLLNLLNNAFYAVHEKRKSASATYEPTVQVVTRKENGGAVIKIIDNGNGIPANVLDKIFQPFFTTKPTGEGTGLGLSLSYDIISAHGGILKVESQEGRGTVFTIMLS